MTTEIVQSQIAGYTAHITDLNLNLYMADFVTVAEAQFWADRMLQIEQVLIDVRNQRNVNFFGGLDLTTEQEAILELPRSRQDAVYTRAEVDALAADALGSFVTASDDGAIAAAGVRGSKYMLPEDFDGPANDPRLGTVVTEYYKNGVNYIPFWRGAWVVFVPRVGSLAASSIALTPPTPEPTPELAFDASGRVRWHSVSSDQRELIVPEPRISATDIRAFILASTEPEAGYDIGVMPDEDAWHYSVINAALADWATTALAPSDDLGESPFTGAAEQSSAAFKVE